MKVRVRVYKFFLLIIMTVLSSFVGNSSNGWCKESEAYIIEDDSVYVQTKVEALVEIRAHEEKLKQLEEELQNLEQIETVEGVYYGPIHIARWFSGVTSVAAGTLAIANYALYSLKLAQPEAKYDARFYLMGSVISASLYALLRRIDKPVISTTTSITEEQKNELLLEIQKHHERLFVLRTLAEELPEVLSPKENPEAQPQSPTNDQQIPEQP